MSSAVTQHLSVPTHLPELTHPFNSTTWHQASFSKQYMILDKAVPGQGEALSGEKPPLTGVFTAK